MLPAQPFTFYCVLHTQTATPKDPAKKKRKKEKAAAAEEQPATPSSSSDASAQSNIEAATEVSPPATAAAEPVAEADPLALDNFALSPAVKKLLVGKGINGLFPIQVTSVLVFRAAVQLLAAAVTVSW